MMGIRMPHMDDPLHAYITGQTEEAIDCAEAKVRQFSIGFLLLLKTCRSKR